MLSREKKRQSLPASHRMHPAWWLHRSAMLQPDLMGNEGKLLRVLSRGADQSSHVGGLLAYRLIPFNKQVFRPTYQEIFRTACPGYLCKLC